jgi:hypothetical protein
VNLETAGRLLLALGVLLLVAGGALILASRFGITRLPGDIVWRGERTTVYFPLGMAIIVSIILTVLLNLFLRR